MIAIFFFAFLTDLITLIQSFWLSNERPTNLLNQNNGLSNKWWHVWLTSPQIFKYSTSKFQKIFSARCWRPGLLMIFSILDTNLNLTLILVQLTSEYLQWNWQGWTATACHDWLTLHIKSELKKKMTFTYYWVALRQLPILYYKIFPQKIPPTLQSPLWLNNKIVIFFLIQTVPVKFPK